MQGPVPNQFNLVVTDMDATVAFYRKLGLTIPDADPGWQRHHRTAALPGSPIKAIDPPMRTARSDWFRFAPPTVSMTCSTPCPPVQSRTCWATSGVRR